MIVDAVLGLQYGDEGKGKISHALLEKGDYDLCIRFNGGCNAGHTIYHNGKKFVTHHIPAGVFFGVRSIIGNGCVVDLFKFLDELAYLSENTDLPVGDLVKVAHNAHIITQEHRDEEREESTIGTTKTGNGPAYRDKHGRKGVRAMDIPALKTFLFDMHTELYSKPNNKILMEGAQGFYLDVDWGNYPYVTSCNTGISAVIQNGIPPAAIRNVYGIIKPYETYVGAYPFQGPEPELEMLQKQGQEFGATTGRKRQCNWLNSTMLKRAMDMNGVTHLIVNKMDIMADVGEWRTLAKSFDNEKQFKEHIREIASNRWITFSYSPETI